MASAEPWHSRLVFVVKREPSDNGSKYVSRPGLETATGRGFASAEAGGLQPVRDAEITGAIRAKHCGGTGKRSFEVMYEWSDVVPLVRQAKPRLRSPASKSDTFPERHEAVAVAVGLTASFIRLYERPSVNDVDEAWDNIATVESASPEGVHERPRSDSEDAGSVDQPGGTGSHTELRVLRQEYAKLLEDVQEDLTTELEQDVAELEARLAKARRQAKKASVVSTAFKVSSAITVDDVKAARELNEFIREQTGQTE